jgi:hypothetical protein
LQEPALGFGAAAFEGGAVAFGGLVAPAEVGQQVAAHGEE